jgi:hypothetical protein
VLSAEYKQRYGELRPGTERYVDQIAPVKWALPFVILGRELQTRMLVFRCSEAFPSQSVAPVPLEITMEVRTPRDTYTSAKRTYQLDERLARAQTADGSVWWIC